MDRSMRDPHILSMGCRGTVVQRGPQQAGKGLRNGCWKRDMAQRKLRDVKAAKDAMTMTSRFLQYPRSKIESSRSNAAGLEEAEAFTHAPLKPGTDEIRVLYIQPRTDNGDSAIQCSLEHQRLTESRHVCLSYMWGDERHAGTILIDDRTLPIRQNLLDFLQVAQQLNICDPLWIDAVSINQNDIEERNSQVRQMAEIYSRARHVIIWPGQVPVSIRDAVKRATWFSTLIGKVVSPFDFYGMLELELNARSAVYKHVLARSVRVHQADYTTCINMPYWNRLWIFQEIFLARIRYVVVGGALVRWQHFLPLIRSAEPFLEEIDDLPKELQARSPLSHLLQTLQILRSSRARETSYNDLSIGLAVGTCRRRGCSDIRDRWYGCLGVVKAAQDFPVDYGVHTTELLLNIVHYLGQKECDFLQEDQFREIDVLADALEVTYLSICLACAQVHAMIDQSRVPQVTLASPDQPEKSLYLLVAPKDRKQIESWTGVEGDSALPTVSQPEERQWPNFCAICRSQRNIRYRKMRVSTTKVASDQLWVNCGSLLRVSGYLR
ncbi:MAG: hypothetical protein Q9227_008425 [Pyrenula ochraceoflavens]